MQGGWAYLPWCEAEVGGKKTFELKYEEGDLQNRDEAQEVGQVSELSWRNQGALERVRSSSL